MIQIGQNIDDFIDDFEFEIYQGDAIKKVKFSNYEGKAVCKLEKRRLSLIGKSRSLL